MKVIKMTNIAREKLITNHLLLDYFDLWDELDIKSANDTREVRYYNQLISLINGQLDAGIRWLDSDDAKEYFTGETEYQREVFQSLEDEWDTILEGKYNSVDALLSEVYRRGKAQGYSDMQSRIRYTDADKEALNIAMDYNYHLIRKVDNDVRSQVKNIIIRGVLAGDHPNTIAPKINSVVGERLDGTNFTPRQRATMIARTEVSRVQNTGILQSYINEGYTEVKILTAEDSNVCVLCLRYAFEYNNNDDITFENRGVERVHNIIKLIKGGLFPPFHPLCRCTYLSVWKSKGKPPENPYVICLMPSLYGMKVPSNLKDSYETVVNFSRDELNEKLSKIINDSDELNVILDLLDKNFRNKVYNTSYEWGAGIGMDGECQKTYSYWRNDNIPLSYLLLEAASNKGILTFIHSHPFNTSPLASFSDYKIFAKNKVKYGIVTNEFGMVVIKNKYIHKNSKNFKKIENTASEIERGIEKDFKQSCTDKNIKYKKWSKNKYYKEFNKYARENHDKYLKRYQKELNEYFDITFI